MHDVPSNLFTLLNQNWFRFDGENEYRLFIWEADIDLIKSTKEFHIDSTFQVCKGQLFETLDRFPLELFSTEIPINYSFQFDITGKGTPFYQLMIFSLTLHKKNGSGSLSYPCIYAYMNGADEGLYTKVFKARDPWHELMRSLSYINWCVNPCYKQ